MMDKGIDVCWNFLKSKSIKVQREWLVACIEWLVEENDNQLPNSSKLVDLVYEQWLMADLQEIAVPVLPDNINSNTTICGRFNLQLKSILDIGHSAYSQLMKVKGQEIDQICDDDDDDSNLKEFFKKGTADKKKPAPNKKFGEKSSRMLLMELSDGYQTINAIEYEPMQDISTDMLPGGKYLLNGPVECCDGIFLLKSHHLKPLGGNVEQLVETSSQLKLLSSALGINNDGEPQVQQQAQNFTQAVQVCEDAKELKPTIQSTCLVDNFDGDDIDDNIFIHDIFDSINVVDNKRDTNLRSNVNVSNGNDVMPNIGKTSDKCRGEKETKKGFIPPYKHDEMAYKGHDNLTERNEIISNETKVHAECDFNEIILPDEALDDFFPDADESEKVEDFPNKPILETNRKEIKLSEMIQSTEPMQNSFTVKGWFKTLKSKLEYHNHYKLLAVLTDGSYYVQVLLADEALNQLVGYSAKTVEDAVTGKLLMVQKQAVKSALQSAEKALEFNKWILQIQYDSHENVYKILHLEPDI